LLFSSINTSLRAAQLSAPPIPPAECFTTLRSSKMIHYIRRSLQPRLTQPNHQSEILFLKFMGTSLILLRTGDRDAQC
jgi:hypothetical protein